MYFLETLQVCAPCHGGVLYSFWYWWNVVWIFYEFFKYWKKNYFLFFSIFQVFFAFHAISNIKKKKFGIKKKSGGGGVWIFKNNSFWFTFYAIFNIQTNIEKCPFTYWLNGRWFLQIVERDSCNLYPLYLLFLLWFCILNVGGGVMFYAISNISRKKNLGIQNNYFSFNVFFVVFFVCWKYCKVPLHLQLLVKWEVVSPNSRYSECYHEIGNIEKFPFTYWLNWRWFLQIVDIHAGNFDMKLTGRWFPQIVDRDSGNLYPIYI